MTNVLDYGYVAFVEGWGSDERIIESARMSTDGGFRGWGPKPNCNHCGAHIESVNLLTSNACIEKRHNFEGDEKLLRYLWTHKHYTPFEMAGVTLEVQAPIFVFREWHRHRSQSYNELSGRYSVLPDLYYVPSLERLKASKQSKTNKQGSEDGFSELEAAYYRKIISDQICYSRQAYESLIKAGVAREVARVVIPVAQYSRMRASGNLRNWLAFLTLRTDPAAQWEIRQYADVVSSLIQQRFPRTWELWKEG